MNSINLVSTLHDPDGVMQPFLEQIGSGLLAPYANVAIVATRVTQRATIALLQSAGAQVTLDGSKAIGESRRRSVAHGLKVGPSERLHYCDLDRLIYWHLHHREELDHVMAKGIWKADYCAIGRFSAAFETHPRVQCVTETITNQAFSWLHDPVGPLRDVTAGSCSMSRSAAELILKHSAAQSNATDVEWPLIIDKLSPLPIAFIETMGLSFETAFFLGDTIFEQSETSENWHNRTVLTAESIAAGMRVSRLALDYAE